MKITYKQLNTNGDVINTLVKAKITSFGTKIKVVKLHKWLEVEAELLNNLAKTIDDEFDLKNKFNFDEEGKFVGENKAELLIQLEAKKIREDELLAQELDMYDTSFTEEELTELDLTAEDLLKLNNLKLFTI